tara:strand:- start:114114 stop:115514 length:1401 start_codon:yes stop_codon:yes gene_type:complete
MIISFVFFLVLFTLIGISSTFKSRNTKEDYYLASASVKPWLVGLSAVATNNSGYMFIGVIGYTYVTGLASVWLMIGWITGDFLASLYIHARLNKATTESGEVSYAGVISHWHGENNEQLQRVMGLLSLCFLLVYASAQLVAGSKALHVLFEWPLWYGAVIGAVIVAIYCVAGGIRASIWTDAAQSIVMIVSMCLLLWSAIHSLGGVDRTLTQMHQVDGYMNWFPKDLVAPGIAGGTLFIVSWLFAGLSVIGQPHIMVRFMTLNNLQNMRRAKIWYYLSFIVFYSAAIGVGMLSRVYLADTGKFDAELALPIMAQQLLSPVLVGLVLAGIFAATISTTDSLVLSCSSTITHDLFPHNIERTYLLKITTILITLCALGLALVNNQSVFNMVIMAWSGLASAFAPLLIVLAIGRRPSQYVSIIAVIVGFITSVAWRIAGLHTVVYEGLPGILAGLLIIFLLGQLWKRDA